MKTIHFILLCLFCLVGKVYARVDLPSVFSDGMVMQRQSKVAVWGKSDAGAKITIVPSWNEKLYTTASDSSGTWKLNIATPAAGGPYTLTVSDSQSQLVLSDIWIGEVWVASGQSNMAMPVRGFTTDSILNGQKIIATAENPYIRFYTGPQISWGKPLTDFRRNNWQPSTPVSVRNFSAAAYTFARELQRRLQVPVGIIQVAWGGTVIQAWMSAHSLSTFPSVHVPEEINGAFENKNTPAGLFNGMIAPIAGYGIKGVIWYQGEQNVREPDAYAKLFPAMVKNWRQVWNADFPFYYAQIAPWDYKSMNKKAPLLREAQLNSLQTIPNSGMAVLTDVGAEKTIHPPDKESVGKRLAYIALAKTYHQPIAWSGPVYRNMQAEHNALLLSFGHAEGLHFSGTTSDNFEIAGADRVFYPAKALITGNKIRVSAEQVVRPVAARYAFKGWVAGDLFNKDGLPASSFRTDNWPVN
ncbi:sialate O-acetylesterase [Pedobacter sp. BS3]|uniref:sialate O-acetylesterase n=1 Tax=Pedobacter sp. BS3 TaxID=2567937 RepID=UPI0011EFE59D|nr:sialate O-acetylesterase [Pedobacter sp. BS3]TZF81108.1 sialate O-acetylesterase [Pedobacter sp. BS3]